MPNRLANEKSLYLRQHAENPVNWYPWGEAAFAAAREQDKPVIISVGYSACHWCHVMAHECFEDDYIATLMNKHFICIKVDREERPDVDQIYMEAVQMITQRGGWPLNAFCLPDGRPFFGGTYFPPEDKGHGIIPWPQLLMRISDHYRSSKAELEENADNIVLNIEHNNSPMGATGDPLENSELLGAAMTICNAHDDEWGGFGEAPKFPPSMTLDFLLAIRSTGAAEGRPQVAARIDQVVQTTLTGMAHGGLFDQIGGGFARYSVDKVWLIPHFEKMLYDNGLLLDIYTKGYLRYQTPTFRAIAEETIGWLQREMQAPAGGFYSALDADSEGEEGKCYVWTPDQIREILGPEEAETFCDAYNITENGNFEHGTSNPALVYNDFEKREALAPLRAKVLAARDRRVLPGRDDKQLLSWNALVIRGLAEAGFYLNRPDIFTLARETAEWAWQTFVTAKTANHETPRLLAVHYPDGDTREPARLDEYAYFAEALLSLAAKADWEKAGSAQGLIERAAGLLRTVEAHFSDPSPEQIGCFFTADDGEKLPTRKKDWFDNATPTGNSSLLHSYAALFALTGDSYYSDALLKAKAAYPGIIKRAPSAISHALSAITQDATGIAVVKVKDAALLAPLQKALATRPWRRTFLQVDASAQDGYQLCIGTQCMTPTDNPEEIAEQIGG